MMRVQINPKRILHRLSYHLRQQLFDQTVRLSRMRSHSHKDRPNPKVRPQVMKTPILLIAVTWPVAYLPIMSLMRPTPTVHLRQVTKTLETSVRIPCTPPGWTTAPTKLQKSLPVTHHAKAKGNADACILTTKSIPVAHPREMELNVTRAYTIRYSWRIIKEAKWRKRRK